MRVLVTGAAGFVGAALIERARREQGSEVSGSVRRAVGTSPAGARLFAGLDLTTGADWRAALEGQDVVVHAAARAHIEGGPAAQELAAFRRVNVEGTLDLARRAAEQGVRRFIYISTIGVNGQQTYGRPFTADDPPAPFSPYTISKREAEDGLRELAAARGLEVVIVRPPLVIGPGAPGNVRRMFRVVARGVPLPLGAIHNRRSFVALDNLADLVVRCAAHPAAPGRTFLVCDGEDLSTTELLRRVGAALGRSARLLPVPAALVRAGLAMVGRANLARQLCQSLQVDMRATRDTLGWAPPASVTQAIEQTARRFLADTAA